MKKIFAVLSMLLIASAQAKPLPNYSVQKFPGKVIFQADIEIQAKKSPLDILFVIDDSSGMGILQNVAARYEDLAKALSQLRRDYHIGVLTTSAHGLWPMNQGGHLIGAPRVITPSTSLAAIANNFNVGTNGSEIEMPFDSIHLALTEPLLSGPNFRFLRPSANLAIVLITDAEDQSDIAGNDLFIELRDLKGDINKVTAFSWIIRSTESGYCKRYRDEKTVVPLKIEAFTKLLNGSIYSLCQMKDVTIADFAHKLAVFGATAGLPAYIREIPLPAIPSQETIKVRFAEKTLVEGDMSGGWIYDSAKNQILLGDKIDLNKVPVGTKLEISFTPEEMIK